LIIATFTPASAAISLTDVPSKPLVLKSFSADSIIISFFIFFKKEGKVKHLFKIKQAFNKLIYFFLCEILIRENSEVLFLIPEFIECIEHLELILTENKKQIGFNWRKWNTSRYFKMSSKSFCNFHKIINVENSYC
jgi:hypothetical protein